MVHRESVHGMALFETWVVHGESVHGRSVSCSSCLNGVSSDDCDEFKQKGSTSLRGES